MKRAYHHLQSENEYLKKLTARLFQLHEALMEQCNRDQQDRRILIEIIQKLECRLPQSAHSESTFSDSQKSYQQKTSGSKKSPQSHSKQNFSSDSESGFLHISAQDLFESCDAESVELPSGQDFASGRERYSHLSGLFMGKRKVQGDVWHQHNAGFAEQESPVSSSSKNDFSSGQMEENGSRFFVKTNEIS